MTREEIRKFLDNTKVYVNGKSKEIQEKLFSFGYRWSCGNSVEVKHTTMPFLFIHKGGDITCEDNMCFFIKHDSKEITADEILSLEISGPSYRPFKDKDECWNEMQKHQPFGWLINKKTRVYVYPVLYASSIAAFAENGPINFNDMFKNYTFADGTPFGIKED